MATKPLIFDEIGRQLSDNISVTNQRLGLRVAGLLFALICLGHLIRIFAQVEVRIGTRLVPMWPSVVAAAITGVLALWLFGLANRKTSS